MQDYNSEVTRRQSFQSWQNTPLNIDLMARTGFFALEIGEAVRCYFCNLTIEHWDAQDDVVLRHLRYSPGYLLLTREITYNEPIDLSQLHKALPPSHYDKLDTRYTRLLVRTERRDYLYTLSLLKQLSINKEQVRQSESSQKALQIVPPHCTGEALTRNILIDIIFYPDSTPKHPEYSDAQVRFQTLELTCLVRFGFYGSY